MEQPSRLLSDTLSAAAGGDRQAAASLLPLVYDELRAHAERRLRALPPGQTLGATALVHEAYLRIVDHGDAGFDHRGHFFGAAARAMRDILVEQARRKDALKRGGDRERIDLEIAEPAAVDLPDDFLAVHEALTRLERDDPRKGQLVDLRFYAGLSSEETAAVLGVSLRTVEREWRYIRAWLRRELGAAGDAD